MVPDHTVLKGVHDKLCIHRVAVRRLAQAIAPAIGPDGDLPPMLGQVFVRVFPLFCVLQTEEGRLFEPAPPQSFSFGALLP